MPKYTEFSDEQIDISSMFDLEFSLALQCVSLPAPINEKYKYLLLIRDTVKDKTYNGFNEMSKVKGFSSRRNKFCACVRV